jgi:hypothetical protein
MRRTALALSFAFASAAVFACAAPEDLTSQAATLTDYCQQRAKIECSGQVVTSCKVKDVSTCVTDRSTKCLSDVPQGTTYVPAAAPACLQAVAAAYQTTTLTATALDTIATACEPIFSGPGAARAPCDVDYDCSLKDGLRCLIPFGETAGKCMQPNVIEAGGACPGEADVCSGPYFCDPKSKVCVAEGGDGSSCSPYYQPCMKGYQCPGSGLFGATCQPLRASGDACTAGADCGSGLCDKAIGQSEGVCADQIQLTALDSLCAAYQ